MSVIRSDASVSDGSGDHASFAFSYASFERVVAAMEELRALGASHGYYFRTASGKETYNLGSAERGRSPRARAANVPTGVGQAYRVTTLDEPTHTPGRNTRVYAAQNDAEGQPLCVTDATAATMNALAKALAGGTQDSTGTLVPKLTEGWLPQRFNDYWKIVVRDPKELSSDDQKKEWGQGAARAVQAFNLGVQIDPLKLLRGDPVQLGTSATAPHHGHSVFCYATRRYRKDEVRFLFLGSQLDTFGVGVRLSDLARCGILSEGTPSAGETPLKIKLVNEDGDPLPEHRYQVQVGAKIFAGKSDAEGRVTLSVPTADTGTLSFWLGEDDDDSECVTWELSLRKKAAARQNGEGQNGEGQNGEGQNGEGQNGEGPDEGGPGGGAEGRAAEEWIVSKSSQPFRQFVYHQGPLESGRSVTHAHRYGRWQVLRKGAEDSHFLFAPWRGQAHAARLLHEFPRYPIRLLGSNDPDYITPEGHAATVEVTTERFYRNTERLSGGYFPIGRSRVWHNGIHLEPDEEQALVYAPFDGRVVAVRLANPELTDDADEPRFPFGSGNFVLLKHAVEVEGQEHEFFSLAMHLADPQLCLEGADSLLSDRAAQLPWLADLALAPDTPEAVDEAAGLDWAKLYLKVWRAPTDGDHTLDGAALETGDLLEVGDLDLTEAQWRTAHGISGGPAKRVSDGATGTIDPAAINADGGLIAPYDAFPSKFTELKEKLLDGEVVDLWEEELIVRCGEPIGHVGTWQGSARLHFEIFSSDMIPMKVLSPGANGAEPAMKAKEKVDYDSGAERDCYFDRGTFLSDFFAAIEKTTNEALGYDGEETALRIRDRIVGDTASAEDRDLVREQELQRFFNQPRNSLAPVFRNLIVRHLSEWGSKVKWETLRKASKSLGEPLADRLEELGKQAAKYAWWDEGLGKDAGLPSGQVAHFYHPITFLAWLEHERLEEVAKGTADALHKSVLELNTDLEGPQGGGAIEEPEGKLLRLRLNDDRGQPLSGARYELSVEGQTFSGETKPGGLIEEEVPREASEGELKFWPQAEDETPHVCPLRIK